MPYVYVEDDVVDLETISDDDLIEELECRGWNVSQEKFHNPYIDEAIWRYKIGQIDDALILLERAYPELYGISKRIKT